MIRPARLGQVLSVGLDVVLFAPAILGGLTVDDLLVDKRWPTLKVSLPRPLRRAMVGALAALPWLSLYGCFAREGLVKAVLKSVRIGELLRPETNKAHAKLALLLSLLRRGAKPGLGCGLYPSSAAEFAQPAWAVCVAAPLAELCANPAFEMSLVCLAHPPHYPLTILYKSIANLEQSHLPLTTFPPQVDSAGREGALWLSAAFVPALAGCRLPRPRQTTVEAALSVSPDTAATWQRLAETPGRLTPSQVLG
jgi:hypothetical protein